MKIAIDVSAVLGLQGGKQVYLQRLLKHLSRLDTENEYLLSVTKLSFSAEDRAAEFSWDEAARRTLAVYKKVAA